MIATDKIRSMLSAFCAAVRPPSREEPVKWAAKHVKINSDISEYYDPESGPYWMQILNDVFDNQFREICVVASPGCGKSAAIEAGIAYAAAEDPGDTLVATDSDERLQQWLDTRLHPMLKACEPLKMLWPSTSKIQKKLIQLLHMDITARPANEGAFQQISCRYGWGDEVWLWKKGLINYFRKRLHDRWNGRTILMSQAGIKGAWEKSGDFIPTDWFTACEVGDLFELFWTCDCGKQHKFDEWSLLKWEGDEDRKNIDWHKVRETLRLECDCGITYKDAATNRRRLSCGLEWKKTRDGAEPRNRTYVIPALAIHRIAWFTLAREWISAMVAHDLGDNTPFFQFWTQRLSRWWEEKPQQTFERVKLGAYKTADFANGEKISDEVSRGMFVDVQQDHFWAVIRAFRADGSSQRLYASKIITIESVESAREHYKVERGHVLIDSRWGGKQMVYDWALRYGYQPAMGSGQDCFYHKALTGKQETKLWSTMQGTRTSSGKPVRYIQWASDPIKDILANLKAGKGAEWLNPEDTSEEYNRQMNSEHKKPQPSGRARWIKHQRDNHYWDCEAMGIFFALFMRILRVNIDADIEETVDSERSE